MEWRASRSMLRMARRWRWPTTARPRWRRLCSTRCCRFRFTDGFERYVMLEQSRRGATVFSRTGGEWVGHVLTGDDELALPEARITLPIAELYEGVTFSLGQGEVQA